MSGFFLFANKINHFLAHGLVILHIFQFSQIKNWASLSMFLLPFCVLPNRLNTLFLSLLSISLCCIFINYTFKERPVMSLRMKKIGKYSGLIVYSIIWKIRKTLTENILMVFTNNKSISFCVGLKCKKCFSLQIENLLL